MTVVAIVDPYSSGKSLVRHIFAQNKHTLIAVESGAPIIAGYNVLEPQYFSQILKHSSLDETVATLRELGVTVVIAGSEPGVELAEQLGTAMNIERSNGLSVNNCRRDKYEMHEQLRKHGIRAVEQCKSAEIDTIIAWCVQRNKYPVVVKPPCSMGTDGVYFCNDADEVKKACASIAGKVNAAGVLNDTILVQEFLAGEEYVIDGVSFDGEHKVAHVWKYKKACENGSKFVYHATRLLPFDEPNVQRLMPYMKSVLTALGLRWGPSHAEVMMCDDGPCLVEVGARMHGSTVPQSASIALEYTQIDLTADVYLDGALWERYYSEGAPKLRKALSEECLVSHKEGVLACDLVMDEVRKLPSYQSERLCVKAGDKLSKTVDLWTCPGNICFAHESEEQMEKDIARLRELEHTTMYVVKSVDD